MEYGDAYGMAKDAVDEAVFADRQLLDAYNEMLGMRPGDDPGFADRMQGPVLDLENEVRGALEALDGGEEETAGSVARDVAEAGADAVVAHLRACMAERGLS